MKKKILALVLCVAMLAIAIAGGTLAYFTDTDAQTNAFTVGDVKIDLYEDFNTAKLNLLPAVAYTDIATGLTQYKNQIEKEVYVENTGTNDAYVRLHIAVPAFTKGGKNINVITCDFHDMTTVDGKWIWGKTLASNYPPRDSGEWNMYRDITINNVPYKVFVVTYETVLKKGDITVDAIDSVHMDPEITQDDIAAWNDAFGKGNWEKVYVVAEAAQADGFDDAITALDTAFGVPGTYKVDFTAEAEGQTFIERQSSDGKY